VASFQLDKFLKDKKEIPFDHAKSIFKQWVKDSPVILK